MILDHIVDAYDQSYVYQGRYTAGAGGKSTLTADRFRFGDGSDPFADTGWVSLTTATGFTADSGLAVRRVGQLVQLKGQITKNSGTISGSETGLVTLPAGFRPSNSLAIMGVGAGTAFMKVVVRPTGAIDLAGVTAASAYLRADNFSWMVG